MAAKKRTFDVLCEGNIAFSSLLLSEDVLKGLNKIGFKKPSPVQLKSIPLCKCGLDLIVQAKSGTGKTGVFAVTALEMVVTSSTETQVIVLAPTREIAMQITNVVTEIGLFKKDLHCCVFIGGTSLEDDKVNLKMCHIAIGTPGRMKSLIEMGYLKTDFVRLFILDEADKLLEPGSFQEQINWIYSTLPKTKQMLALSATYPEYLAKHLINYMNEPMHVRLNTEEPTLLGIKQYYTTVSLHHLPHVVFERKAEKLTEFLKKIRFQQCMVFSNYQNRAQMLADMLSKEGWPASCIAGSQSQEDRFDAMMKLKKFQCRILISTDLTSRGIDCDKVDLVVNLDMPWDTETYLHRTGRAGRFGGYGMAINFVAEGKEEKKLMYIAKEIKHDIQFLSDFQELDISEDPHRSSFRSTKSLHKDKYLKETEEESNDCELESDVYDVRKNLRHPSNELQNVSSDKNVPPRHPSETGQLALDAPRQHVDAKQYLLGAHYDILDQKQQPPEASVVPRLSDAPQKLLDNQQDSLGLRYDLSDQKHSAVYPSRDVSIFPPFSSDGGENCNQMDKLKEGLKQAIPVDIQGMLNSEERISNDRPAVSSTQESIRDSIHDNHDQTNLSDFSSDNCKMIDSQKELDGLEVSVNVGNDTQNAISAIPDQINGVQMDKNDTFKIGSQEGRTCEFIKHGKRLHKADLGQIQEQKGMGAYRNFSCEVSSKLSNVSSVNSDDDDVKRLTNDHMSTEDNEADINNESYPLGINSSYNVVNEKEAPIAKSQSSVFPCDKDIEIDDHQAESNNANDTLPKTDNSCEDTSSFSEGRKEMSSCEMEKLFSNFISEELVSSGVSALVEYFNELEDSILRLTSEDDLLNGSITNDHSYELNANDKGCKTLEKSTHADKCDISTGNTQSALKMYLQTSEEDHGGCEGINRSQDESTTNREVHRKGFGTARDDLEISESMPPYQNANDDILPEGVARISRTDSYYQQNNVIDDDYNCGRLVKPQQRSEGSSGDDWFMEKSAENIGRCKQNNLHVGKDKRYRSTSTKSRRTLDQHVTSSRHVCCSCGHMRKSDNTGNLRQPNCDRYKNFYRYWCEAYRSQTAWLHYHATLYRRNMFISCKSSAK